jgi:hypothetical protein
MPPTVTFDDSEIREGLSESFATILNVIHVTLERTSRELSADISVTGLWEDAQRLSPPPPRLNRLVQHHTSSTSWFQEASRWEAGCWWRS